MGMSNVMARVCVALVLCASVSPAEDDATTLVLAPFDTTASDANSKMTTEGSVTTSFPDVKEATESTPIEKDGREDSPTMSLPNKDGSLMTPTADAKMTTDGTLTTSPVETKMTADGSMTTSAADTSNGSTSLVDTRTTTDPSATTSISDTTLPADEPTPSSVDVRQPKQLEKPRCSCDDPQTPACPGSRQVKDVDCPCRTTCLRQSGQSCSPAEPCDAEFGLKCNPQNNTCQGKSNLSEV